jgi:argininosuccinate synthase
MFRANTVYEGEYLLGTSIARPLIAKRMIEIANLTGADAVAHGATGKGNDQVRFELGAYALRPDIRIIAPWREWDLLSREKLLAYAEQHGIPVEMKHRQGGSPYSMDANLLHISYEGRHLEDRRPKPRNRCGAGRCRRKRRPMPPSMSISNSRRAIWWRSTASACRRRTAGAAQPAGRQARHRSHRPGREPLRRHEVARLLRDARRHHPAAGAPGDRVDHPRPRSRPSQGRPDAALRQPDLQRLLVEPGALALQTLIDHTQQAVNGWVRVKLYKGNVIVVGRDSKTDSLFDSTIATFEDDAGAYDQKDAAGFHQTQRAAHAHRGQSGEPQELIRK